MSTSTSPSWDMCTPSSASPGLELPLSLLPGMRGPGSAPAPPFVPGGPNLKPPPRVSSPSHSLKRPTPLVVQIELGKFFQTETSSARDGSAGGRCPPLTLCPRTLVARARPLPAGGGDIQAKAALCQELFLLPLTTLYSVKWLRDSAPRCWWTAPLFSSPALGLRGWTQRGADAPAAACCCLLLPPACAPGSLLTV